MGSPWPWTQQPVKTSSTGSSITPIHNNNNNNKRPNYGYNSYSSSYYNNQHNHDFHQQNNMHQHHHNHRSSHTPTNNQHHHHHQHKFPTSSPSPTDSEPMITSEPVMKKPTLPSYFTFEGMHQHQNQPHHHTTTNNNYTVRKLNSTASSTSHQSEFFTFVKEIPTWNIYYSDQKHRIIDFTGKEHVFFFKFR